MHIIEVAVFIAVLITETTDFMVNMFKTYVRPLLEYNTVIRSSSTIKYIDKCEQVQWHFTKCIRGLWNITYRDRLRMLNLESLEERRMKNNIICVYILEGCGILHTETDYEC